MRPEDLSDDARQGAELAAFAARLGENLRASDRAVDHSQLVKRVLSQTSREDLGRRADLRLVGSYLRERLAQSALLRFAAASLVVHILAVPVVLAWVLLSERGEDVYLRFEPPADARPFEEALPLNLEPLQPSPASGLEDSSAPEFEGTDDQPASGGR